MSSNKKTPIITTGLLTRRPRRVRVPGSSFRNGGSCSSLLHIEAITARRFSFTKQIRFILTLGLAALPALSQAISLHGQVTDETGAVIPGAIVTLTGPDGVPRATVAAKDGSYSFS